MTGLGEALKIVKNLLIRPYVLLAIIILVQTLLMCYYADQKSAYHRDEYYSIIQTNGNLSGTRIAYEEDWFDQWHSSEYFRNFTTVQHGERFIFRPAYKTLSKDAHPPFYFMQLHAISSLFPDTFDNRMGAFVNIFWLAAANIMLYLVSRLVLRHKYLALLPCAVWGFSAGAMSCAVLFRPYAVLTFFFTALLFLTVLLITGKRKADLKFCIVFGLVFFFGFLTQYYFIIFFIFAAAGLIFWFFYKREYKQLRNCVITTGASFAVYIAVWPAAIKGIFGSGRGAESFTSIMRTEGFFDRIKSYIKVIDNSLFGNEKLIIVFAIIAIVLLIVRLILYFRKGTVIKQGPGTDAFLLVFLLLVTVPYVLIIARITPYVYDRYIFAVYPALILLFLTFYYQALFAINRKAAPVLLVVISIIVIAVGFHDKPVQYIYKDAIDTKAIIQSYENPVCIAVQKSSNMGKANDQHIFDFEAFNWTYICKSTDSFLIALNDVNTGQDLLLYLIKDLDKDEIFEGLYNMIPYKNAEFIYSTLVNDVDNSTVYDVYHIEW